MTGMDAGGGGSGRVAEVENLVTEMEKSLQALQSERDDLLSEKPHLVRASIEFS